MFEPIPGRVGMLLDPIEFNAPKLFFDYYGIPIIFENFEIIY